MTSRVEGGSTYTQAFDTENRLTSVTVSGQVTTFAYDPDGNLVKKINPDGSKTLYVGGIYEVNKNSSGSVTGTVTYYPEAGAMRVDSTPYFILKDHLESASVVTDGSGDTVGEQRYYPFGETRVTTGTIPTDKLFTGQHEITGLGIYHYGARFYSPKLGRFLSADNIIPSYTDPQDLNRFSYVSNNPLRYIDPTGHREVDSTDGAYNKRGCGWECVRKARAAQRAKREDDRTPPPTPTRTTTPTPTATLTATITATPSRTPPPTFTPGFDLRAMIVTPKCQATPCIGPLPSTATARPYLTSTPQPTSEFWAIVREEHSPGDPRPSQRIPPGFSYDIWQTVDAVVKYLGPLAGYPATTKNIANALSGQTAVRWTVNTFGPAVLTVVRTGAGFFAVPKSLIAPPPVYQ